MDTTNNDKNLRKTPTVEIVKSINKASRLPCVSETKFITINPVKEPMGKRV